MPLAFHFINVASEIFPYQMTDIFTSNLDSISLHLLFIPSLDF